MSAAGACARASSAEGGSDATTHRSREGTPRRPHWLWLVRPSRGGGCVSPPALTLRLSRLLTRDCGMSGRKTPLRCWPAPWLGLIAPSSPFSVAKLASRVHRSRARCLSPATELERRSCIGGARQRAPRASLTSLASSTRLGASSTRLGSLTRLEPHQQGQPRQRGLGLVDEPSLVNEAQGLSTRLGSSTRLGAC